MDEDLVLLKRQIEEKCHDLDWSFYIPCGTNCAALLQEFQKESKGSETILSRPTKIRVILDISSTIVAKKLARAYHFILRIQSVLSTIKWNESKNDNDTISVDDSKRLMAIVSKLGIFFSEKSDDLDILKFMEDGYIKFSEIEEIAPLISDANIEKITSQIKIIFEAYADENQKIPPKVEPVTYYVKQ